MVTGLTSSEAAAKLAEFGPNEPFAAKRRSPLVDLLLLFINPLAVILLFAAVIAGFLNFLHPPPIPGPAGQYMGLMAGSFYMKFVFAVQLLGGLLLLSGQFVPLALVLLGPVIVNILLFHVSFQPAGLPPGLLTVVLWLIIFFGHRQAFAGIFAQKATVE